MSFEEINPSIFLFKNEGDFIEGFLIRKQEKVGANESMLYSIDVGDSIKSIWGSAILDERMQFVNVGSKIRVTFKGLGEAKGDKQPPKLWKVEIDKSAQQV